MKVAKKPMTDKEREEWREHFIRSLEAKTRWAGVELKVAKATLRHLQERAK